MILFSNDKEIIFKITNAVLLIWFIAAIVFMCSSIINMVVEEPQYTYEEYSSMNCSYSKDASMTDAEQAKECLRSYNNESYMQKNDNYYQKISLFTSMANVIIVGGVMFFLNRKSTKKNKVN